MKACNACSAVKSLDEFVKRRTAKDGREGTCKECVRRKSKEYAAAHPEQIAATKKRYRQRNPEKHRAHVKRSRARNPEARKRRDERYRERHPEASKAAHDRWRAANPERAREVARIASARRRARKRGALAVVIPYQIVEALKAAFDYRCAWCNAPTVEHLDHVVPLSKGGKHEIGNIVPSCAPCNRKKRAREPRVWAERCGVSLELILEKSKVATAQLSPKGNENAV